MNIFNDVKLSVIDAVKELAQREGKDVSALDFSRVTVEPPRDASHGDMATNIAMILSKPLGAKPRDLAEKIAEILLANPDHVAACEIAGPGFLNLTLKPESWHDTLFSINKNRQEFGVSDIGKDQKINVEYVSANPTGPVHFGHTRNAVLGDALANLLEKAGFEVSREYYVNDGGAQVETLGRSVFLRYKEALGHEISEIPEGLYPGEYLIAVGQLLASEYGERFLNEDEEVWLETFSNFAVSKMLELIKTDLKLLNINFNVYRSEKELVEKGNIDKAVEKLDKLGLVYTGTLPPPKSNKVNVEDWEPKELLLFKSTEFGDDQDRPLKKSDGSWAYTTPDIAYEYDKFQRGFENLIVVVGADHVGWVKRLTAGTKAVSEGKANIDIILYGLVNLMKNGEPFKLSKRAGNILTLREIVDMVGAGVVRFTMLTRKAQETLDFDVAKAVEQSKDNPYFYVQYAHARCCSVIRHAQDLYGDSNDKVIGDKEYLKRLSSEDELAMIKLLASWPRLVEQAAIAREPHRVAFYAQEVASALHSWWNKGRDDASMRFLIEEDEELSKARVCLVHAVADVIASALAVIGVEALDEMRSDVEIEAA